MFAPNLCGVKVTFAHEKVRRVQTAPRALLRSSRSTRLASIGSLGMTQYGGLFAMSAQTCRDRPPGRSIYAVLWIRDADRRGRRSLQENAMADPKPSPAVRTVVALRQRRACYASIAGTAKWWMRRAPISLHKSSRRHAKSGVFTPRRSLLARVEIPTSRFVALLWMTLVRHFVRPVRLVRTNL